MQNNIKFPNKVNTKSNLKSNILKELCEIFGFEFERFKDQIGDIDRLIQIRNSIAHGENSINPDFENLTKYINSVNKAMDIFRDEIEFFLTNEAFLLPIDGLDTPNTN